MAFHAADMGDDPGAGKPPFCTNSQAGCNNQIEQLLPNVRTQEVNPTDPDMQYFTEVFRSSGIQPSFPGLYPMVRIFQVNYPHDIDLRVNDFQEKIAQNAAELAASK
jgi:hypothetical protein